MKSRWVAVGLSAVVFLTLCPTLALLHAEDKTDSRQRLEVHARDALTGQPIPHVYFSLLAATEGRYAKNCIDVYAGHRLPAPGDRLVAFAPNYDACFTTLESADLREMTVALVPAQRAFRVVNQIDEEIAGKLRLVVRHYWSSTGDPSNTDFIYEVVIPVPKDGVDVRLPSGLDTVAYTDAGVTNSVWPLMILPKGGETVVVRSERMRRVALNISEADIRGANPIFLALPSLTLPSGWPPQRVDGLIRRIATGLRILRNWSDGQYSINSVPEIGVHLFSHMGGRSCYRFVEPKATEVNLAELARDRISCAAVSVGGEDVGDGAWILPGRLDLNAVTELRRRDRSGRFTRRARDCIQADDLPVPAEDYTIWDPGLGIAYARLVDRAVLSPGWERGGISVRRKSSSPLTGRVSVWATLVGTGMAISGYFEHVASQDCSEVEECRFVGLPLGAYRIRFEAAGSGAQGDGPRVINVLRCPLVELTAETPVVTVQLE